MLFFFPPRQGNIIFKACPWRGNIMKSTLTKKYIDFKCSECGAEEQAKAGYKRKTTLCRSCINQAQKKPNSLPKLHKRLHFCWQNMKQRCNRKGASGYEKYGGKGISVCKEWNDSFETFALWALANGYEEHLTIDRRDGTENYKPSNCRWVTYTTQSCNTKLIHKTNTSGYRGVSAHGKRWRAYVGINRKQIRLGIYSTPEEAAKVRDRYIVEHKLEHTLNNKELSCRQQTKH